MKGVMVYPGVKKMNSAVLSDLKFIRDQNNPIRKKPSLVNLWMVMKYLVILVYQWLR